VHRRRAELDQRARGAGDVECARAEARIDVDEEREIADIGDAANVREHVVEVRDAEIGHAQRTRGDAGAGKVDRAVAHALRHHRVVGADGTYDLQGPLFG